MLITVAICTYRRHDRVDRALASLCRQTRTFPEWEVLVVENDNEASPSMAAVCQKYMRQLPLRHLVETSVGLSYARNTAVREARGDYLAYLDDDAEADSGWLAALVQECRESRPDFCGGPSYPLYLKDKPKWYPDKNSTTKMYGDRARWLGYGEWLGGMNFTVLKILCLSLGGFRTDLGMQGNRIAYGEETDLMMRAWNINPRLKVRYLPDASVRHEVRPEKMSLRWNVRTAWGGGRSSQLMDSQCWRDYLRPWFSCWLELARQTARWLLVNKHGEERRPWQWFVLDVICPWVRNVSRASHGLLRRRPKAKESVTRRPL